MRLENTFVTPGGGFIVYIPNGTDIEITAPDHEKETTFVEKDSWILFSHTAPRQED